jgi:hypothetical protein
MAAQRKATMGAAVAMKGAPMGSHDSPRGNLLGSRQRVRMSKCDSKGFRSQTVFVLSRKTAFGS